MSSNPTDGSCVPGEVFGGVLTGVVIVTNVVSIIVTYFITKKVLSSRLKTTSVSIETAAANVTNNFTQPVTQPVESNTHEYLAEDEYADDSEFTTDSEEDIDPTPQTQNHQQQYNGTAQPDNHNKENSTYDTTLPTSADLNHNENLRAEFENNDNQIYDEPEGFDSSKQHKNPNANTAPDPKSSKYLDFNAESERATTHNEGETEYVEPDPNTPGVPPDKPTRNNSYVNRALDEGEEAEYEVFGNPPPLPKRSPPPIKKKPKAPPKPVFNKN